LVLNEKGRIRSLVWSEHRRVNIDVFGRWLLLEERLHHLVEAKDVVEVADPFLGISGAVTAIYRYFAPLRRRMAAGRGAERGEDTKRNLKHVGYLFSLVKARRKLLT
jgi:hypothetical protein